MILRTAAALALCSLLPLSLAGQDPPLPVVGPDSARASVTHVVEEGETLAALARAYLGGAHEWERIYEANRDVISDPDRILPGMRLVIPGGGVPAAGTPDDPGVEVIRGRPDEPPARVTGVQVEEPPEAREPTARDTTELPELGPSEVDRRRLLQSRPFTPSGVPMHEGPRTVFWGNLSRTAEGPVTPTVHLQDDPEALVVSPSAFYRAAWLAPGGAEAEGIGQIAAFSGDRAAREERTTLQPFDEVRVRFESTEGLDSGDRLLAFHEVGRLSDQGRMMAPSGLLEVRSVEGDGALARVTNVYDRLALGHYVRRPGTFPLEPGVHPTAADVELRGTVLGFRDRKEIYVPGDQAFVDLGGEDGLAVGDELVGVVGDEEGWAGRRVARFRVVAVQERSATVHLLSSQVPSAVRPGLRVAVNRKMP